MSENQKENAAGMDRKKVNDFIYLTACSLNNVKPDEDRVKAMDLDAVVKLAKAHKMAAL